MSGVDGVNRASGPSAPAAPRPGRPLRFGYGTNGFANHRLDDAVDVLAELGYDGVALTLDHCHLDPFDAELARHVAALSRRLADRGLGVVVETGARYLLDRWRKHAPTLLHQDGRERRLDFLRRAARVAADLGAEAVSFWSGALPDGMSEELAWKLLADGCASLAWFAASLGVPAAFEPEPGMLVADLAGYQRLLTLVGPDTPLALTLDIGHCQCLEPRPIAECVRAAAGRLVNVQIEDMRRGAHEHLEFGAGEIDFPPALAALADVGYRGLVSVELPRHSHAAPALARSSLDFLIRALPASARRAER